MTQLTNIFKWLLPNNNSSKIGLSQFKEQDLSIKEKTTQRKSKDIKLSDLMRRAS